jgi:hypothetical protein
MESEVWLIHYAFRNFTPNRNEEFQQRESAASPCIWPSCEIGWPTYWGIRKLSRARYYNSYSIWDVSWAQIRFELE